MKSLLENSVYAFDPAHQVWMRPGYDGISYSDGDETELRIANIIAQATDITVLSTELRQHCTDWPSLYHLSGTRANILRPFAEFLKGDVLEIGAGCGAITRYLGECGANVIALEGSPRRASIARSRTRDLEKVTVLAEKFDAFQCEHRFDVITLIGVLEYANLFTPADNPPLAMLQRIRSLLKPDGKLVIAIENQFGLKYFAGAPEDHLGHPMYGIEGRYTKEQPQTFGKQTLTALIESAEFSEYEFLAPFPDYKLPVSILTEAGISNSEFDAAAFAWQSARRDPQLPSYCTFSPELAWPEIFKNGLGLEVANSFLLIASPSKIVGRSEAVLAYHYSTDRQQQYCKETLFRFNDKNEIRVNCHPLAASMPACDEDQIISFKPPADAPYTKGKVLSQDFIQIVSRDGWSLAEVGVFIQNYISLLVEMAKQAGYEITAIDASSKLPGELFDAIPQNILIASDGSAVMIDREWSPHGEVTLGWVLFRSLLWMSGSVTRYGLSSNGRNFTRGEFVRTAIDNAGIHLTDQAVAGFIEQESAIQKQVTGHVSKNIIHNVLNQPLPHLNLHHAVLERDKQITCLNQDASDNLDQIAHLNDQVDAIYNSTSWRITKPLRVAKRFLSKYQTRNELGNIIRTVYKRIPINPSTKIRIKGHIFRLSGGLFSGTAAYKAWAHAHANGIDANNASVIAPGGNDAESSPNSRLAQYIKGVLSQPLPENSDHYVEIAGQPVDEKGIGARAIAFYLPQFHPIPENDKWWGKGFTEWTNVAKAVPQFIGHYQPHLPGELGFYDLRIVDVMRRQAELAKLYGIEGFCFHYYWFGGRRLLERPLEQLLSSDIDLPFCICWANENWTRRWDGRDSEVLMEQSYGPVDDLAFIKSLEPYLRDKRYIRVNGKPIIILYRPSLLPDARATLECWRNFCREIGIGELFIGMAQFDELDPRKYGFDAAIEFPPHKIGSGLTPINDRIDIVNGGYAGCVVNYSDVVEKSVTEKAPDYPLIKGVFPSWDNEARKPGRGYTVANSSPDKYRAWLRSVVKFSSSHPVESEKLVFINAWNEWAEGAHLEPDRRYGYAYLEATKQALLLPQYTPNSIERICVIIHAFYPELLGEMLDYLKEWTIPFRIVVTTTPCKKTAVQTELNLRNINAELRVSENRGRDILPFLNMLASFNASREIILKLHTKRSLHRTDGDAWRKELLHKLLSPKKALKIYNEFQRSSDLGMVGPEGHILSMNTYWGMNANNVKNLVKKMGIYSNPTSSHFAAGSMFYIRPEALQPIARLNLKETDFEQESGQVDGTLAHAIERCFSISIWESGHYLASSEKPELPVFRVASLYQYANLPN